MDDGKSYGFKSGDVARLKRETRHAERYYRNRKPSRSVEAQAGWQGMLPAKATTGIAAGSIASPGSATVTLLVPSGTGMTTTGGDTITCYNAYTSAVTSGALIWVTPWNNQLFVVGANC